MFSEKKIKNQSQTKEKVTNIPKPSNKTGVGSKILNALQALGKSIQFPIAVLPFAAILNRFGALGIAYTTTSDPSVIHVLVGNTMVTNLAGYWISYIIQTPGAEMFNNLPLLFAIGIGFGLAKDHRGEAALASVAFFLVTIAFTKEHGLPEMIYGKDKIMTFTDSAGKSWTKLFYVPTYASGTTTVNGAQYVLNIGVLGGIVSGCMVAFLYNHFKNITLPQILSFFGGRRFIPMFAIATSIPFAFGYAIIWPWIQLALGEFSSAISGSDAKWGAQVGGAAAFGILNRLMLAFGLHMILNAFLWFQVPITGDKISPISGNVVNTNITVNGDINAFTAGIASSGNFQSGFFPIMMGGLPAAVVAMIFVAKKENRESVAGFLGGAAFISFLTGITEPIEYSFIFLSPVLLLVHALFTGLSFVIVIGMQMHVGFGFSAGFIDYCISIPQSWGIAQFQAHGGGLGKAFGVLGNPLMMLPIIIGMFALYFFTFVAIIKKMDIKTPGREEDYVAAPAKEKGASKNKDNAQTSKYRKMAEEILAAIGIDNIEVVDNCATRLRLELKDNTKVDLKRIKDAGVFGTKTLGTKSLQIIIGPDVEHVADILHDLTKK